MNGIYYNFVTNSVEQLMSRDTVVRSLYKFIYYAPAQGALSDDAV